MIRNDRLMAIINETHQAKHKVGQVGYVAEPWGYNYFLDEGDEQPAETMPASLAETFQRCEGVSVEKADDGWVFVYDWKQITREEAEAEA